MCVAIYNQANSHKLFSAQLTLTTESSSIFSLLVASKSLFRTPVADKIWNRWRTAPTIRSTWMWTFANLQVASTCTSSTGTCTCSWSQLLVNHHPDTYRCWLEYQRMRAPKPVLLFCGQPLGLPRYQRCVTLTWRPAPPLVSQGSRVTENRPSNSIPVDSPRQHIRHRRKILGAERRPNGSLRSAYM